MSASFARVRAGLRPVRADDLPEVLPANGDPDAMAPASVMGLSSLP